MPPSTPNLSYRSTHPSPLTEQAVIAMMMQQYQSSGWIHSAGRARLKHEEEPPCEPPPSRRAPEHGQRSLSDPPRPKTLHASARVSSTVPSRDDPTGVLSCAVMRVPEHSIRVHQPSFGSASATPGG